MRLAWLLMAVCILLSQARMAFAQHACAFHAQNPDTITVTDAQNVEREVEIDFMNSGVSTWQNTGGVSNLQYIELRPVGTNGLPLDGPLYHATWINRQRVGSFLAIQQGVAPQQVARFVFKVQVNGAALGIGSHDCYFRPYHAQGGYINDWGNTKIRVVVTSATVPPTGQVPVAAIQGISPASPMAGSSVQFSGTGTNNPIEHRWEANGQVFGSQAVVTQVFAAGTYSIRFLARNQYGWSQAATTSLTVQAGPAPIAPGPTTMACRIQSAVVEKSLLRSGVGTGAYVVQHDLVSSGPTVVRRYQTLQLLGAVSGGTAAQHEWSVAQNGLSKVVGTTAACVTQPSDLYVGRQDVRYRARDPNGNWTPYDLLSVEVSPWPQLYLPVHGQWTRSGNDYNQGDHLGDRAQWSQDWNSPAGGHSDFGLEMMASLPGRVSTGRYGDGGRVVNIEYDDPVTGLRFKVEYMHLSSVLVRDGQSVVTGQPIGLCGDTGSASQSTHLHYVLSQWVNGSWLSVAPEPYFLDDQTVRQVSRYGETVTSNNRVLPQAMLVLAEQAVSAPYRDEYGYGHAKYWGPTTAYTQPTSYATWDFIVPASGVWKLWMHNPSHVTNSNDGLASHNSTLSAIVEISRPRVLGLQTYYVNQAQSVKGGLIEVTDMDVQAGDRIFIRQHNATGEAGKEISYDELVMTLEVPAGSGGLQPPAPPPPIGTPTPVPSPLLPQPVPTPSPNTSPSPSSSQPFGQGGGGGGGGCALSNRAGAPMTFIPFFLLAIMLFSARRLHSLPSR